MDLQAFLSIPYLLEAEAIETRPGEWLIRLSYPELEGCNAEGAVVEQALERLERQRIECSTRLVEAGKQPPIPRQPLASADPLWTAKNLGLSDRVSAALTRRPS